MELNAPTIFAAFTACMVSNEQNSCCNIFRYGNSLFLIAQSSFSSHRRHIRWHFDRWYRVEMKYAKKKGAPRKKAAPKKKAAAKKKNGGTSGTGPRAK